MGQLTVRLAVLCLSQGRTVRVPACSADKEQFKGALLVHTMLNRLVVGIFCDNVSN